uniref:Uncharacterized protein n=1 Tax=Arundo donax TaxID=35708 RepID=A0A0A9B5Q3_ARUDO
MMILCSYSFTNPTLTKSNLN